MNLTKFIPNAATRSVGRHILQVKKHSPGIMFGVGIAGVVTSAVLACRATLKLDKTVDITQSKILDVKDMKDRPQLGSPDYTERDYHKDLVKIYSLGAIDIVKLYAPAVLIGTASIGLLTGSHVTLNRRNASLTAAYAAVQTSFDQYRDRVKKELGVDEELDIYHAATYREVEGEDKKILHVRDVDPNVFSPYARMFEESNINWRKDPEHNKIFIIANQNYLNHMLQSRGHVFLNEAYDALGLERSKAGQIVGWVIGDGDNFIDFGVYEARNANFANGFERNIVLDFNVDGVVFDKFDKT